MTPSQAPFPENLPEKDLLSIREAVKYTGLSAATLWRYIAANRLHNIQHGGSGSRVLLRRVDLIALSPGAALPVLGLAPAAVAAGPSKLSGPMPAWKSAALNK